MKAFDENTLLPAGLMLTALATLWKVSRAVSKFEHQLEHHGKSIDAVTARLEKIDARQDAHDKKLDHHAGLLRARRRTDRQAPQGDRDCSPH